MLTDCRLPLLVVMLCLLESGCISVRYGQHGRPHEPTPAARSVCCGEPIEVAEIVEVYDPAQPQHVAAQPQHETAQHGLAPPLFDASCLSLKPWHSRLHAAWPGFWKARRVPEPPPVAPLIPPRPRFHPVPTRPVFARQVIFESVPPVVPLPEPVDTPSIEPQPTGDPDAQPLDAEAGQAPRQLSDELRVASPISPGAQAQAR